MDNRIEDGSDEDDRTKSDRTKSDSTKSDHAKDDRKTNDPRTEKGSLKDALSAEPFTGSAQYGEGGYYQERARMHVQKDYSIGKPQGADVPDHELREAILESMGKQIRLDAEDIQIEVQSGVVTLRGRVDSQYAKQIAEQAAGSLAGVHTVHNLLELDDPRRVHGDSPQ